MVKITIKGLDKLMKRLEDFHVEIFGDSSGRDFETEESAPGTPVDMGGVLKSDTEFEFDFLTQTGHLWDTMFLYGEEATREKIREAMAEQVGKAYGVDMGEVLEKSVGVDVGKGSDKTVRGYAVRGESMSDNFVDESGKVQFGHFGAWARPDYAEYSTPFNKPPITFLPFCTECGGELYQITDRGETFAYCPGCKK